MAYANEQDHTTYPCQSSAFARFCQDELKRRFQRPALTGGYRRDGLLHVCRSETIAGDGAYACSACLARTATTRACWHAMRLLRLEPSLTASTIVGGTLAVMMRRAILRLFTERSCALAGAAQSERPVRFRFANPSPRNHCSACARFAPGTSKGPVEADVRRCAGPADGCIRPCPWAPVADLSGQAFADGARPRPGQGTDARWHREGFTDCLVPACVHAWAGDAAHHDRRRDSAAMTTVIATPIFVPS